MTITIEFTIPKSDIEKLNVSGFTNWREFEMHEIIDGDVIWTTMCNVYIRTNNIMDVNLVGRSFPTITPIIEVVNQ